MAMFKNPEIYKPSAEAKQLRKKADPYAHVGYSDQPAQRQHFNKLDEDSGDPLDVSINFTERTVELSDPLINVYATLNKYGAATLVSIGRDGRWIAAVPQNTLKAIAEAEEKRAQARKSAEEQTRRVVHQFGIAAPGKSQS